MSDGKQSGITSILQHTPIVAGLHALGGVADQLVARRLNLLVGVLAVDQGPRLRGVARLPGVVVAAQPGDDRLHPAGDALLLGHVGADRALDRGAALPGRVEDPSRKDLSSEKNQPR